MNLESWLATWIPSIRGTPEKETLEIAKLELRGLSLSEKARFISQGLNPELTCYFNPNNFVHVPIGEYCIDGVTCRALCHVFSDELREIHSYPNLPFIHCHEKKGFVSEVLTGSITHHRYDLFPATKEASHRCFMYNKIQRTSEPLGDCNVALISTETYTEGAIYGMPSTMFHEIEFQGTAITLLIFPDVKEASYRRLFPKNRMDDFSYVLAKDRNYPIPLAEVLNPIRSTLEILMRS